MLKLLRILGLVIVPAVTANAEIILHGTRVVYPAKAREVTLQISNDGDKPALMQAWIDEGDVKATPDQSKAPFMITPPVSRIEPTTSQSLRIVALPGAKQLDQNKETLLWLNVLDIPPKPKGDKVDALPENFLQLAVRSRIKFFYRPISLKSDANLAPEQLKWQRQGQSLRVHNPTPYHITMTTITQSSGGQKVDLLPKGLMLKPFSEEQIALGAGRIDQLSFIAINDYGGRVEHPIVLQ